MYGRTWHLIGLVKARYLEEHETLRPILGPIKESITLHKSVLKARDREHNTWQVYMKR